MRSRPAIFLTPIFPIQVQQPTASSWGENGYFKVWINEGNSWMYPFQHDAERRMTRLANKFAVQSAEVQSPKSKVQSQDDPGGPWTLDIGLETRVLNAMARELLLAQSSDWAFQIYQGTTVEYSSRRFQSHIHRFDLLAKMIESVPGAVATGDLHLTQDQLALLTEIENRDNIFAEIDYRVYCS